MKVIRSRRIVEIHDPKPPEPPTIEIRYDSDINRPEEITAYLHCAKCIVERSSDPALRATFSPRDYARTQIGVHAEGLQVVCTRHNVNIAVISFKLKEAE